MRQFGSEPGRFDVTPFKETELQPDGAVGINCFDIAGYFCPIDGVCVDFAFLEGFLVVKSPVPLDVVRVIPLVIQMEMSNRLMLKR
jgi:hypothetical protein